MVKTKVHLRKRRRLYTAVASLLRKLIQPGECIWHWSEDELGEVSVLLIDRRSRDETRRMAERFGEAAGCGRDLVFRKVKGRWVLVGEGCWIT